MEETDEKKLRDAKNVYETVIRTMDKRNWHYDRDDEKLFIRFGVKGDDMPMDIRIQITPDLNRLYLISEMPFEVQSEHQNEIMKAVLKINNKLPFGMFDYGLESGKLLFDFSNCYNDCLVGEELISFMLDYSTFMIDKYNDQLLMVSKGAIGPDDIDRKNDNNG
jgi:hypothetical protein